MKCRSHVLATGRLVRSTHCPSLLLGSHSAISCRSCLRKAIGSGSLCDPTTLRSSIIGIVTLLRHCRTVIDIKCHPLEMWTVEQRCDFNYPTVTIYVRDLTSNCCQNSRQGAHDGSGRTPGCPMNEGNHGG